MTRTPASSGTPGVTREFVGLTSPTARRAGAGGHPCQGLYHRGVGRKPKVAMIATHYQIDFSEHYLADYMATRGIGFLGWNTRYRGFESSFLLDHALVDIGVGVRWLREVAGRGNRCAAGQFRRRFADGRLPGAGRRPARHAAGGHAARGRAQRPAARRRLHRQRRAPRPTRRADRLDGRVGRRRKRRRWQAIPTSTCSTSATVRRTRAEFVKRYRAAQIARNNAITDWAEAELKRVHAAGFSDRPFTVHAHLGRPAHGRSRRSSRRSVRPTCATPGVPVKANRSAHGIAAACTLRNWLGMWSLRHAQTRAEPHLARITAPRW